MTDMDRSSRLGIRCLLLAGALSMIAAAHAHPYDSPLEFRAHRTEDGRLIYSNIPKKCFANGRLTCYRLHPIFPATLAPKSPPAPAKN